LTFKLYHNCSEARHSLVVLKVSLNQVRPD